MTRVIPPHRRDPDDSHDSRYYVRGVDDIRNVITSTTEPLGAEPGTLWYNPEGVPDYGVDIGISKDDADELYTSKDEFAAVADVPPRVEAVETAVGAVQTDTALLTAQRFDPTHPDYGAIPGTGLSSAQRQANVAAFNAAAVDAAAVDGLLTARGTFEVEGEINVATRLVDLRDCVLRQYDANAVTLTYGRITPGVALEDPWAYLPLVRCSVKPSTGWTGTGTGVRISNVISGHLFLNDIRGFPVGLDVTAFGYGTSDNNIHLIRFTSNKVNVRIGPGDVGGWVNENNFIGGKWQIAGAEGFNIPGARHIQMRRYPGGHGINKNVFLKPNLEGSGPEYQIEMDGVYTTVFFSARLEESTGQGQRVLVNDSYAIRFTDVYGLDAVTWSGDSVGQIDVDAGNLKAYRGQRTGGVLRLQHNDPDANDPTVLVNPPEESTNLSLNDNGYLWRIGTRRLQGKSNADTQPRLQLEFANAVNAIALGGGGTTAPDVTIGRYNTSPEGASSARPGSLRLSIQGRMYIKESGIGTTGWKEVATVRSGSTASRPTASSVAVGSSYFDTTLNKPVWSDGTAWVDATGTVVEP